MAILRARDCRMLQYMAGERRQDVVASEEVAESCGVREFKTRLK